MKYLNWLRDNINLISVLTGLGFIISGRDDLGRLLINVGGQL